MYRGWMFFHHRCVVFSMRLEWWAPYIVFVCFLWVGLGSHSPPVDCFGVNTACSNLQIIRTFQGQMWMISPFTPWFLPWVTIIFHHVPSKNINYPMILPSVSSSVYPCLPYHFPGQNAQLQVLDFPEIRECTGKLVKLAVPRVGRFFWGLRCAVQSPFLKG